MKLPFPLYLYVNKVGKWNIYKMEHLQKQKQYHLLNSDDTRGFEGRCSHVVYRHCIYNIFFTHILTSIR